MHVGESVIPFYLPKRLRPAVHCPGCRIKVDDGSKKYDLHPDGTVTLNTKNTYSLELIDDEAPMSSFPITNLDRSVKPHDLTVATEPLPNANAQPCRDCGVEFTLDDGELRYFRSHNSRDGKPLQLPVRCSDCRAKRRLEKENVAKPTAPPSGRVQETTSTTTTAEVERDESPIFDAGPDDGPPRPVIVVHDAVHQSAPPKEWPCPQVKMCENCGVVDMGLHNESNICDTCLAVQQQALSDAHIDDGCGLRKRKQPHQRPLDPALQEVVQTSIEPFGEPDQLASVSKPKKDDASMPILDGYHVPTNVLRYVLDAFPVRIGSHTARLQSYNGDTRPAAHRSVAVLPYPMRLEEIHYDTAFKIPNLSLREKSRYVATYFSAFVAATSRRLLSCAATVALSWVLWLLSEIVDCLSPASYLLAACRIVVACWALFDLVVLAKFIYDVCIQPCPHVVSYAPHALTQLLMDLPANVTLNEFDTAARQKLRRYACLPLTDYNALPVFEGTLSIARGLSCVDIGDLNWRRGVPLEPDETQAPYLFSRSVTASTRCLSNNPTSIIERPLPVSPGLGTRGDLIIGAYLMVLLMAWRLLVQMVMTPKPLPVLSLLVSIVKYLTPHLMVISTDLCVYGAVLIFLMLIRYTLKNGSTAPVTPSAVRPSCN
jgi:hypothetical protein